MNRWVTLAYALLAAALLAAAARVNESLVRQRRGLGLNQADPLENAPPMVAFTAVALGGFRGVLVDMLWMRASTLQQEGKYFELVQLADWITKLEPRYASIWAFHAWNLAYNISVMLDDYGDRWRWVRQGLSLIRDRGLHYNPGSAPLYRELSWLFLHKMAMDLDNAHVYYKRAWAREMTDTLGGGRPDFDALARDPGRRAALEAHRLDPARMEEVDAVYGPLDWRLPQASAIYWAHLGLPFARTDFERLSLQRNIFQAMADAFLRGRLVWRPGQDVFVLAPNLDLLTRVQAAYLEALAQRPGDETVRTAYTNFLVDATVISFSYNRLDEARRLYAELAGLRPDEPAGGGVEAFVARTYSSFMDAMSTGDAMAVVESAFYQAFFWRELGEDDQADGYEQLAQACWRRFMAERDTPEFRERTGLPAIETIRARARDRAREALAARPPAAP